MTVKLIRISGVMEMTGKSRSGIYADITNGSFPNKVSIGAKSVAWLESDITEWIQSKVSEAKQAYSEFLHRKIILSVVNLLQPSRPSERRH